MDEAMVDAFAKKEEPKEEQPGELESNVVNPDDATGMLSQYKALKEEADKVEREKQEKINAANEAEKRKK